ncbi:MAG TPA: preQ(1) synthase [Gammaproteobacteria bacterium]|jgi:7-cyano-7-deazaguanine reductase|nr:preQ(1) synthase [Gammaproteobacteria bacterium]|tara:strand:- start:115 stop:501 length:387 start_codon:yes stop_codon:yes gene_type:complete
MNKIKQIEILDRFKNPQKKEDYFIEITVPEFTCLCPKTGQPDFAILYIKYIPKNFCLELKSLKLYIVSFRNVGAFHESITNQICDDLSKVINPQFLSLKAQFNVRGGIHTSVEVQFRNKEWKDLNHLI